jgi:hypothetical protein
MLIEFIGWGNQRTADPNTNYELAKSHNHAFPAAKGSYDRGYAKRGPNFASTKHPLDQSTAPQWKTKSQSHAIYP